MTNIWRDGGSPVKAIKEVRYCACGQKMSQYTLEDQCNPCQRANKPLPAPRPQLVTQRCEGVNWYSGKPCSIIGSLEDVGDRQLCSFCVANLRSLQEDNWVSSIPVHPEYAEMFRAAS
jgi:hypothetical protein